MLKTNLITVLQIYIFIYKAKIFRFVYAILKKSALENCESHYMKIFGPIILDKNDASLILLYEGHDKVALNHNF